jgi:hypothetical protein
MAETSYRMMDMLSSEKMMRPKKKDYGPRPISMIDMAYHG